MGHQEEALARIVYLLQLSVAQIRIQWGCEDNLSSPPTSTSTFDDVSSMQTRRPPQTHHMGRNFIDVKFEAFQVSHLADIAVHAPTEVQSALIRAQRA